MQKTMPKKTKKLFQNITNLTTRYKSQKRKPTKLETDLLITLRTTRNLARKYMGRCNYFEQKQTLNNYNHRKFARSWRNPTTQELMAKKVGLIPKDLCEGHIHNKFDKVCKYAKKNPK